MINVDKCMSKYQAEHKISLLHKMEIKWSEIYNLMSQYGLFSKLLKMADTAISIMKMECDL